MRALATAGLAALVAAGSLMLVPALLGYQRYVITGGSMGDALPRGNRSDWMARPGRHR